MAHRVINTTAYLTQEAADHLTGNGCDLEHLALDAMSEAEMGSALRGAAATVAGGELYTEAVFQAADSLKIVARTGAGVDHVDLAAASKHGVWVTNTPAATSGAVSEFTIGLILCVLRNIPAMVRNMKAGTWEQFRGRELGRQTLGIVGTGSIGREVIRRARAFGANVLACDIQPDPGFAAEYEVRYVELDELMAQSDIVSIHCALTEQTRGLIDARRLRLMSSSACLVNTSRAPVVDKDALIEVLRERAIAGAAIDVHDPAPCAPDDPLVALDNVIATPWTAYRTDASIERMCIMAVREIVRVLQGKHPQFPVNRLQ